MVWRRPRCRRRWIRFQGAHYDGARVALVAGDRDIEAGTVAVKDLTTGEQVSVSMDSVVAEVISRLAG